MQICDSRRHATSREKYENKASSTGSVVAAEVDVLHARLIQGEGDKETVLPILLAGSKKKSLPPLIQTRTYADFRREDSYFSRLFDLILTLTEIPFDHPGIADLRAERSSQRDDRAHR